VVASPCPSCLLQPMPPRLASFGPLPLGGCDSCSVPHMRAHGGCSSIAVSDREQMHEASASPAGSGWHLSLHGGVPDRQTQARLACRAPVPGQHQARRRAPLRQPSQEQAWHELVPAGARAIAGGWGSRGLRMQVRMGWLVCACACLCRCMPRLGAGCTPETRATSSSR
jgi:hypothetical protein